jgi:hypothetical protein
MRTPPNCPFWSAWTKVTGSTMSDTFCLRSMSTVAPRGKPVPQRPDAGTLTDNFRAEDQEWLRDRGHCGLLEPRRRWTRR